MGGELTYEFSDHSIVLQPGDMAHIPAGEDHKHRPSVVGEPQQLPSVQPFRRRRSGLRGAWGLAGEEDCCYFLTEFE